MPVPGSISEQLAAIATGDFEEVVVCDLCAKSYQSRGDEFCKEQAVDLLASFKRNLAHHPLTFSGGLGEYALEALSSGLYRLGISYSMLGTSEAELRALLPTD